MNLPSVLQVLYSDDLSKIIPVLNASKYAEEFYPDSYFIIHLGFIFEIQTKTKFELLYDIETNTLIRQPSNRNQHRGLPTILGLNCYYMDDSIPSKHFIYGFDRIITVSCDLNGQELGAYEVPKNINLLNIGNEINLLGLNGGTGYRYSNFQVIDEQGKIVAQYPLHKLLPEVIFYGSQVFKIHDKNSTNA